MLHSPAGGQTVFEVAIYNKVVRALVKENQSHWHFDDQWADLQIRDVTARDEAEARKLVGEQYPADEGFVIDKLYPTSL